MSTRESKDIRPAWDRMAAGYGQTITPTQDQSGQLLGNNARQRLLADVPVVERRLQLAGISTPVMEGGDGRPVVLLHGPMGNATHWMDVIPALACDSEQGPRAHSSSDHLIWGRHDLATPLSVAEEASTRFEWPLYVIENCNDDPPVEQPEAFLNALDSVLGPVTVG